MKRINIDDRLKQIASFVRHGKIAADIGTDHAYLPVWLIQNGVCDKIIAGDINDGPCRLAAENVRLYGLADKIEIIQTDGLNSIDKYQPDDIIIAGMGGELIWDIVSASQYIMNDNIRLILQPMTKSPLLRKFLLDNGFHIIDETLAVDDRRLYEIMYVAYGVTEQYSEVELLVGKKNIENRHALFEKLVNNKLREFAKKPDGGKLIEELRRLL
jgi:Predicted SAM-dependent methyltransferase